MPDRRNVRSADRTRKVELEPVGEVRSGFDRTSTRSSPVLAEPQRPKLDLPRAAKDTRVLSTGRLSAGESAAVIAGMSGRRLSRDETVRSLRLMRGVPMTRRHVDLLRVMPPTALHPAVMRGLAHGMRDARAGLGGRMPVSGWGSVVSGGAFDMEFDSSWSPPMDEDSLQDTQSFVWATFWSDLMDHIDETGMTFARVHDLIRTYDASTEPGNFWTFGWGPTHQGFLYAVQLILTYHASLLESISPCDDAAYLINYLLTHRDRFFKIKADWGAEFTHFASGGLTNLVTQVSGGALNDHSLGQYNSFTSNITISGSFAHEFAFIADNYLYQAHRACWYTNELRVPDLLTGIYYLWQAQQLGKLALGSISNLSHTIIHELCHRLYGTNHCSNGCCMQRVAMRFQCNLSAKLGLYAVGFGDDRIDLDLTGVSFFRGSMCRSGREAECPIDSDRAGGICMECTMDNPGDEASPDAWASTSPWTRPVGCD